jgi:tripartite-type tricarboxylate transporter receptor subunit TctC
LTFIVLANISQLAFAQTYPARPVRFVTPLPAGSGADLGLRVVADQLSRFWSQPVVVENRPGANGFIALGMMKTAPADGYTLAQASSSQLTTHPLVYRKLPYDPARDFEAVTPLFWNYYFIVVAAGASWRNVADLVAAARARPGALNYGSGFVGSPAHLGSAALEAVTGTQMVHVPFKETAQLFVAVGSGDVAWTLSTAGTASAALQAGKVRLLALAAPVRLPAYKDVPTVAEAGGPAHFEVAAWTGIVAPAGTSAALVNRLNRDIARALSEAEVRERYAVFGYEPYSRSPGEMVKLMAAETARYAPVIKRLNLTLD